MLTSLLIDGAILATGAALAGLVGAICRCQGRDDGLGPALADPARSTLARVDLGLSLLAWIAFLAVLLLATMPSPSAWALLPALLLAGLPRLDGPGRWLQALQPGELVELKFAAVMGLLACASGLVERWMRHPPIGVEPGLAGLWHHFMPALVGCVAVVALLVAIARVNPLRPAPEGRDA